MLPGRSCNVQKSYGEGVMGMVAKKKIAVKAARKMVPPKVSPIGDQAVAALEEIKAQGQMYFSNPTPEMAALCAGFAIGQAMRVLGERQRLKDVANAKRSATQKKNARARRKR